MINNFWHGLFNGLNFGMHWGTPTSCCCNNFISPGFNFFVPSFNSIWMSDPSVFNPPLLNMSMINFPMPQMNFFNMSNNMSFFPSFPTYPSMNWGNMPSFGFDTFNGSFGANFPTFGSLTNTSYSGGVNNYAPCDLVSSEAARYLGKYAPADAKRKFSKSGNHGGGWCADFATYCAKRVLPKYPQSMVTASPVTLRDEAKRLGCYQSAPSSNKSAWAKNNIKPGDLVITGGNGQSGLHVIVAKEVRVKDGKTVITAYSGNDGNSEVIQTDWPVESGRYSKRKGKYLPVYGVVNVGKFA